MNIPKVTAADLKAAAQRLAGAVVQFVEDGTVGPAVYKARMEAWATIEGDDLGADDGTIVCLVLPGQAAELIAEHGSAGKAAAAVNRELRAEVQA